MCSIASCQLFPQLIALGGSTNLIVSLNQPAPASGVSIALNLQFKGSAETLVSPPTHLDFLSGQQTRSTLLPLRKVPKAANRVLFSARLNSGGPSRSAELDIFS
jgi:hypothetical protein